MKQEIFELIVKARESIFELQNYLFENHREYYLAAKGVLETSMNHIADIEETIDQADDDMCNAAKKDLSLILYTINKAKDAYNAPVVQNVSTEAIEEVEAPVIEPTVEEPEEVTLVEEVSPEVVEETTYEEAPVEFVPAEEETTPVVEEAPVMDEMPTTEEPAGEENETIEFNEEELNNLLAALDSANFEAIFADEDMPVTEETAENVEVPSVEETFAAEEVVTENTFAAEPTFEEAPVVEETFATEEVAAEDTFVAEQTVEETPVEFVPTEEEFVPAVEETFVAEEVVAEDTFVAEPTFEEAPEITLEESEENDIQALDAFLNENAIIEDEDEDAFGM